MKVNNNKNLVDKMSKSHKGDPASALLEILDPEQNSSFLDHYIDLPIDLSKVLFICTANILDTIPDALLDRMEVIHLSGYTSDEKLEIAQKHLLPKLYKENGIKDLLVEFEQSSLRLLLKEYARENGVRNLKRLLEKIIRKAVLSIYEGNFSPIVISESNLHKFAGTPIYNSERLYTQEFLPPGVVTGLAWTQIGGATLYVESIIEYSKSSDPHFTKTGQLGKVMQESSSIALSYAKSYINRNFPENSFFVSNSVHLHVPEGSTPKDGPSAGITMAVSLLSLALNKSISSLIAMTGELTLTGKILKIGGVKEKVIAAKRSGITKILLPFANKADWDDLKSSIIENIEPIFVNTFDDVALECGLV